MFRLGKCPKSGGCAPKVSHWQAFKNYLQVGFVHIVPKGLDHILFVVGLFLLSTDLRPLLVQVTSFTLAHSVTLAMGIYGIVTSTIDCGTIDCRFNNLCLSGEYLF